MNIDRPGINVFREILLGFGSSELLDIGILCNMRIHLSEGQELENQSNFLTRSENKANFAFFITAEEIPVCWTFRTMFLDKEPPFFGEGNRLELRIANNFLVGIVDSNGIDFWCCRGVFNFVLDVFCLSEERIVLNL